LISVKLEKTQGLQNKSKVVSNNQRSWEKTQGVVTLNSEHGATASLTMEQRYRLIVCR